MDTTEELLPQLEAEARRGVPAIDVGITDELSIDALPYHRWAILVAQRALPHTAVFDWPTESGLDALRDDAVATARTTRSESAFLELSSGVLVWVRIARGSVFGRVAAPDEAGLSRGEAWVRERVIEAHPAERQRVSVEFWSRGSSGPYSVHRTIAVPTWEEVASNYPAAPRAALAPMLLDWRPSDTGRLLLWHGPPGTGKTHALRALAWEWRAWCDLHYITDPERFFGSSDYMLEVLTQGDDDEDDDDARWSLLVLEDTGELLSADAKARTGQGLSRLLNVVDGLIGQGLRVLLLVTTNEPLGTLHGAVARPGRCASRVEFPPFAPAEAAAWLRARGSEAGPSGAETLADLFARLSGGYVPLAQRPIGFRTE